MARKNKNKTEDWESEYEIKCTIDEEKKEERRNRVEKELIPNLKRIKEKEEGFVLVFREKDGLIEDLMGFVRLEHKCCSFAYFEIRVTPGFEPIELYISGPEGSKQMFEEGLIKPISNRNIGEIHIPKRFQN